MASPRVTEAAPSFRPAARRGTAGAAEVTKVQPGEVKCSWCGQDLQPRRGGSPQRFCSAEHRSLFWSALRRWGERAVAAGILTIADIRNGDPAACTLLLKATLPAPIDDAARRSPTPVAPCAKSHYSPQQNLERLMAQAIAMRRR